MHDFTERGLAPRTTSQVSFAPYVLRATRKTDGLTLAHMPSAIPNSADFAVSAMARLNSNISGVCIIVQFGSEWNPPGSS